MGCGHCHSLNNQVQDDSAGFSAILAILKKATGLSLVLKEIRVEQNWVIATMENGGVGKGYARRAITPQEKVIIQRLVGKEIINTHTLVMEHLAAFTVRESQRPQ